MLLPIKIGQTIRRYEKCLLWNEKTSEKLQMTKEQLCMYPLENLFGQQQSENTRYREKPVTAKLISFGFIT